LTVAIGKRYRAIIVCALNLRGKRVATISSIGAAGNIRTDSAGYYMGENETEADASNDFYRSFHDDINGWN
jgi:hypothetical protein